MSKKILAWFQKKPSILNNLETLNELEIKAWLSNNTTLKIIRLLKIHRNRCVDSILNETIESERTLNLMLGRCKGYDDIVEFLESMASDKENLEQALEAFINNRKIEL